MSKVIADIDVSGTAKADIYIGYEDTLSLSISFRNSITNAVLDISASTIKLNINNYTGKSVVVLTPTIASNVATFDFDAAFWAKVKKNDYDFTITKTDGSTTQTLIAGQFKPGAVAAGCGCGCITADGVTPYTIEVTVGSTGTVAQWYRYEANDTSVITHSSLANTIEPILYVNGTPNDVETNIIVQNTTANTLTFPFPISGIVRWKA